MIIRSMLGITAVNVVESRSVAGVSKNFNAVGRRSDVDRRSIEDRLLSAVLQARSLVT